MKPRVHFHSDNSSFAGCEQMLVVLFGEALRTGDIVPSFTYRASHGYEDGVRKRIPPGIEREGLRLPDVEAILASTSKKLPSGPAKVARWLVRLLAALTPIRQFFQIYDIFILRRAIRRRAPEIVHVNNGGFPGAGSCNAAAIAAKLAGVPHVVYVVNNQAYGYGSLRRLFDYPIDRVAARCVSRFVTGSTAACQRLTEVLRLPTGKAIAIPNGIAERQRDETPEQTRRRLGIEPDDVLIVSVGALETRKGHHILIEAFGLALSRRPDIRARLVIDGEGPQRRRLLHQISELGLEKQVSIIDPEPNVWNLYSASDIVVLASLFDEDFPNVVLEAMANAKPVVASRIAGTPEQVLDGVTGILVRPGDTLELSVAIEKLVLSPELRNRLGNAGRKRFEEHFTAEAAARRYFDLYNSLLSQSSVF